MLVPATKARSIDPQNTPNRGDQWGIRPAGRTPGRPHSATKLSPNARGTTSPSAPEERDLHLCSAARTRPEVGLLDACRLRMGPVRREPRCATKGTTEFPRRANEATARIR